MKKRKKGRVEKFEARNNSSDATRRRAARDAAEPKRKKKFRIHSGRMALTVIVVILIAVLGMSVKNIFVLQAEKKALTEENKALLLEKESLQEELKNVSDTEYIEEQARIQLKLIKPGEILYILEDEQGDSEETDEKDN